MAYLTYTPRSTLYHYTSKAGFDGIVRSREVWLSDLRRSNDPRELSIGYNSVFATLAEAKKRAKKNLYSVTFISDLENDLVQYMSGSTPYCLSLSLAGDTLPMWAAYGGQYTGLCIGFRPTAFYDMPIRLQKVRYTNSIPDKRVIEEINDLADRAARQDRLSGKLEAVSGAFALITSIKHDSWSYEDEVRILHAQRDQPPDKHWHPALFMKSLQIDGTPVLWSEPSKRNTQSGEVRYLKFPFGRYRSGSFNSSRSIAKVIIGPNCNVTKQHVEAILTDSGFVDFEVLASDCQIKS